MKPKINAKGMGLFAKAYLQLYESKGHKEYLVKARDSLSWLERNSSSNYSGMSWGYPFNWQSKEFISASTPSSVVTSIVGDAFWTAWTILKEEKYLEFCKKICDFFMTDLNVDHLNSDTLCFSYTPVDNFHVHNANLFVAEFLVRIGLEVKNENWVSTGLKAANYALIEQQDSGLINYWGRFQEGFNPSFGNDHYHIGFEIRLLFRIYKLTGLKSFKKAYRKYYQYYKENMYMHSSGLVVPKMTPISLYPIDIHSCAEAIILNALILDDDNDANRLMLSIAEWVILNMQTSSGSFVYSKRILLNRVITNDFPFIRWSQAWMLLALSDILAKLE